MQENKISIIIPVYNTKETYLKKCLQSIIDQTYLNLEILLIDDGSEEWCKASYEKLKEKDDRIKCIVQNNQGVSVARNNGIENASGNWIMFVDADDWLEPDCCQSFINRVQKEPNTEILIGKPFLNKEEKEQKVQNTYNEDKIIATPEERKELLISILDDNKSKYHYVESVWSKLFHKEFLLKNNISFQENLRIGEDCLFTYKAYNKAKKIYYINKSIYHYRINETSISNAFNSNLIKDYNKFLSCFENLFQQDDILYLEEEYISFGCKQIIRFIKKYYANPNNPKSYKELKKELTELICTYPYKNFLTKVNLKPFPMKNKMILVLLKKNLFPILYPFVQLKIRII